MVEKGTNKNTDATGDKKTRAQLIDDDQVVHTAQGNIEKTCQIHHRKIFTDLSLAKTRFKINFIVSVLQGLPLNWRTSFCVHD